MEGLLVQQWEVWQSEDLNLVDEDECPAEYKTLLAFEEGLVRPRTGLPDMRSATRRLIDEMRALMARATGGE